jgi:peptidoglycan hydrolase-like protein with peptidoglycan-binding domain
MTTFLKQGSQGPEVIDLQYILLFRGGQRQFDPGPIDGIFGPKTKAAVVKFQAASGLVQDGIVGPKTWTAFFPEWFQAVNGEFLKEGMRGSDVSDIQNAMKFKGVDPGPIDGIFGPKTKAAVIKFQTFGEPSSNVVGVVGPITWGGITGG